MTGMCTVWHRSTGALLAEEENLRVRVWTSFTMSVTP